MKWNVAMTVKLIDSTSHFQKKAACSNMVVCSALVRLHFSN